MRLRHPDGSTVHLAYCTNVHPAEDLDGVLAQLSRFGEPVRERLGVDRLGLGLWLAAPVATALDEDPAALARLRTGLASRGLEVVTLNGFPYRGFHERRVKGAVYRPDWTEPERLRHTLVLARLLADLLPEDAARGSVSTVPLGWRTPWGPERQDRADAALDDLDDGLAALADRHGRPVRVGLEPEPGCVVETTEQAARLLAPRRHVGVCLDACHLAVGFEEPAAALERLSVAGLALVKLQASAALHVADPGDAASRAALGTFVEERFLHQVRSAAGAAHDDLDLALAAGTAEDGPWRVHFHVPVHAEPAPPLASTRGELARTLAAVLGGDRPVTDHVEVETYTWGVLPPGARPVDDADLVAGIAAEVAAVRDELLALGTVPVEGARA